MEMSMVGDQYPHYLLEINNWVVVGEVHKKMIHFLVCFKSACVKCRDIFLSKNALGDYCEKMYVVKVFSLSMFGLRLRYTWKEIY
mmetsp:Transcript_14137/g.18874  ORF Transcript_14137/g.18874 Transcript_14137/m.18874 type:complete len:85 (+) Transcript_14137:449-703(+)